MGGEQWPSLIYTFKDQYKTTIEWCETFGLITREDYKQFCISECEEDCTFCFHENCRDYELSDTLNKFLTKNNLTEGFLSNCSSEHFYIGILIDDYDSFNNSDEKYKKLHDLVEKYKLNQPTIAACICGEV